MLLSLSTRILCLQTARSDEATFVPVWRNIFFDVFLFVGPIVLLSLLISIVQDTYDKVRRSEEAEVIKCRARIVTGVRVPRFLVQFSHYVGNKVDWIPLPWARLRQLSVRFNSWTLWAPK